MPADEELSEEDELEEEDDEDARSESPVSDQSDLTNSKPRWVFLLTNYRMYQRAYEEN